MTSPKSNRFTNRSNTLRRITTPIKKSQNRSTKSVTMTKIILNNNNNDEEVSQDNGGSMKKGPWTPAEDSILIEYVNKYGEGNWNSVQKNSGLLRCGKSCRLRWANHLRPNLKKGAFSQEEEKIIIDLHAKLGNKWARMAAQLPGRTDNEIKNFWNTRMKRRQRAGLPLYPPEVQEEANAYHLQQQHYFEQQPYSPPSSSSFSLLLSSCYPKKLNESNHYSNPCLTLPSSPVSLYGSSSSNLFNQSFAAATDSHDYQYSGSYNHGFNNTPASSNASGGIDGLMGASSMANNNEFYEVAPFSAQGNSGLLDALLVEAQSLSCNHKSKSEDSNVAAGKLSYKRKSMAFEEYAEEGGSTHVPVESAVKKNSGDTTNETLNSTEKKKQIAKDPLEEMNSLDDDLLSLLNNFPSEMPMPEWYRRGDQSQSLGLETQPHAPSGGPTDQEFAWTLGTCWNNMPRIC